MQNEEKVTVLLRLPSTLSTYSGGKSQIILQADTVEQLLDVLERQHPLVWERLCTEHGFASQSNRFGKSISTWYTLMNFNEIPKVS